MGLTVSRSFADRRAIYQSEMEAREQRRKAVMEVFPHMIEVRGLRAERKALIKQNRSNRIYGGGVPHPEVLKQATAWCKEMVGTREHFHTSDLEMASGRWTNSRHEFFFRDPAHAVCFRMVFG